jgi:uroporphyrinogen decarboxylase
MGTKKNRLKAVIAGEMADRVPVALWRHFPVADQDAASLAEATAVFQKQYDFDFVKVTPASSFCIRDWGVEDEWRGNPEGTRDYTRRVIGTPEDWEKLAILDPMLGSLGEQLRCLKSLRNELGDQVPIIQTIFSPLSQAKNLAGQERLLEHLRRDPASVKPGLEVIAQSSIAFVQAAREQGIDGIFYAVQHATYKYFDRESYARFGEMHDRRILEVAGDMWLNVLHLHGEAIMFDLAESYPVQVINWHDRETWPDILEGKRRTGAAVCGGIRRRTMVLGTPADIRREADEAIQAMGGGRGMILGTGCVVPVHAPRVNLLAARSAVNFA